MTHSAGMDDVRGNAVRNESEPTPREQDRPFVPGSPGILKRDRRVVGALTAAGRPFWWTPPLLVALGSVAALTEGLSIGLLIPLFSVIFGEGSDSQLINDFIAWLGQGRSQEQLIAVLALSILALATLRAAIVWAYEALSIWTSGRMIHELRSALFRQLLDVGYVFFLGCDRGRLLDTVRGETWRAGEFLLGIARMLISLCAIAVLGIFLIMISLPMTLGAAVAAAVIALIVRLKVRRAHRRGQEALDRTAVVSGRTAEMLGAMRTVRLFGQERREQERFARASDELRKAAQRVELTVATIQPMTELLYTPLFLGVLLAAWLLGTGFPALIGFMALLYRIQPHARRLDHLRVEVAGHLPAVQQIAALLDSADKPYLVSGHKPFAKLRHGVEFEAVSFSYEAGPEQRPPAVSDLSFTIRCRDMTAIVGESGAGKSTAVNLLVRLYDPTSGRILVDGTPLAELRLDDWRQRLAFAGQDAELIGDTVFDAIAYARPDADMASVERAADQANASEFILKLPKGYATPIGPGGVGLSAGQRQRLGLARALLCDPEVLVLDEATNALDSLSERLIQSALRQLHGTRTIVVIAHRLSSIEGADQVIVMKDGRVAERGSPAELLRHGRGAFAELWRAQGLGSSRADA